MKRDKFYENLHRKNIRTFTELAKLIVRGLLQIVSISVDEPQFGHRRVVILLHDVEE